MRVWLLAGGQSELYRGVATNPLDVHFIEILEVFDHGHYIMFVARARKPDLRILYAVRPQYIY